MPHSEPWRDRAAETLGHHAPEILIASIIAVVLLGVKPLPGVFTLSVPIALLGVVLVSWAMMRQHDRQLCEHCVVAMPGNPAEHATRYRRRFWMAHTGSEPRFLVPYLVVLIGSNFATSPIAKIGWAFIQLTMVYVVLSYATHRKFQPWCPWCSEDGGGDHVEDLPPVLPSDDHEHI